MSIVDLADEELETPDVVRPNRPAVGHAITQHADAGLRDGVSRNVSVRGHKYFRRSRHNAALRNFRRPVHRCREALQRIEQAEIAGRVLSGKLFSTNLPQIYRGTLWRRATACDRARNFPPLS